MPLRRPAKLRDELIDELIHQIVSGEIEVGQKLPTEVELVESSGYSRTVVREVIRTLEENSVIDVWQGRGAMVRPQRYWNLLNPVVLDAVLSSGSDVLSLAEIFEVRTVLESLTVKLAARHHDPADAQRLLQCVDDMGSNMNDPDKYRELDLEFHELLAEISGNPLAGSMIRALHTALNFSTTLTNLIPGALEQAQRHHRRIAKAVVERDEEKAEAAIREHLGWTAKRAQKLNLGSRNLKPG